jgi:hypothetical protein
MIKGAEEAGLIFPGKTTLIEPTRYALDHHTCWDNFLSLQVKEGH